MTKPVRCQLSPSLALIKYWGKRGRQHIPATTSIATSLNALHNSVTVAIASKDELQLNGQQLSAVVVKKYYLPFLDHLRAHLRVSCHFAIDMLLNFPLAAGLASSSSIFASLTLALTSLCNYRGSPATLSSLARQGSTSAARAIFGGFVIFPAGARAARPLPLPHHWSELRIIVAITDHSYKRVSTRPAMSVVQRSSFAYRGWVWSAQKIATTARAALREHNLEKLGEAMRASYLGMHATMLAARPPILYWNENSIKLIHLCEDLRLRGIEAWETMDAGPQVKILTTQQHVPRIMREIEGLKGVKSVVSELGVAPQIERLATVAPKELVELVCR